jgi:hypothetical protein
MLVGDGFNSGRGDDCYAERGIGGRAEALFVCDVWGGKSGSVNSLFVGESYE